MSEVDPGQHYLPSSVQVLVTIYRVRLRTEISSVVTGTP